MKLKQILVYFLVVALAVLSYSCMEDDMYLGGGDMQVKISAKIKGFEEDDSRAVFDESDSKYKSISKYCFLYFEGTGNDAPLLFSADITPTNNSVNETYQIKAPLSGENRAILLGNVALADLGDISNLTLGELNEKTFEIDKTFNNPQSTDAFTWSGYFDVVKDTKTITFSLNPNVAKVNVQFVNNDANLNLLNFRLIHVRNKVRFTQAAQVELGVDEPVGGRTYVDYDKENISLSKNADGSYSWYVPHNQPVEVDGNEYSRKSGIVPTGSTYVEVDVVNSNNNICSACRIYPGDLSIKKTFDIKAGHVYNIKVTITNGIVTGEIGAKKSAANTEARVLLPSDNNCYMIHPKVQILDGVPAVYELPIYERINEYWGTNWGYDGVGNVSANVIGDNTEWEAEVIWQDIKGNQLLYFCDEDRSNKRDTYSGKGLNSLYFTLDEDFVNECIRLRGVIGDVTYNEYNDIYGSILVGVKKKGETKYLWSWHLWVTDYYPYELPPFTDRLEYNGLDDNYNGVIKTDFQGAFHYHGSGGLTYWGNVHHYGQLGSTSNGSTGWKWSSHTSDNVWDGNGIYAKKWIMDRNLGSQAPSNGDIIKGRDPVEAFGMFYQYGRKDPLPHSGLTLETASSKYSSFFTNYKLCDIKGQELANGKFKIETGPVTMNEGVQNPTTIYNYNSGISFSWTTFNGGTNWYTPQKNMGTGKKTIFDPCPPGYCIPTFDAFDFLNGNIWKTEVPPLIAYRPRNTAANNYNGLNVDPIRSFCVSQTSDDGNGLEFVLPCQGYISPSYSTWIVPLGYDQKDTRGYYWVLDRGVDPDWNSDWELFSAPSVDQGQALGVGEGNRATSAFGNDSDANGENEEITRTGHVYYMYRYAGYRENFSASRGHNIRCVQEPD